MVREFHTSIAFIFIRMPWLWHDYSVIIIITIHIIFLNNIIVKDPHILPFILFNFDLNGMTSWEGKHWLIPYQSAFCAVQFAKNSPIAIPFYLTLCLLFFSLFLFLFFAPSFSFIHSVQPGCSAVPLCTVVQIVIPFDHLRAHTHTYTLSLTHEHTYSQFAFHIHTEEWVEKKRRKRKREREREIERKMPKSRKFIHSFKHTFLFGNLIYTLSNKNVATEIRLFVSFHFIRSFAILSPPSPTIISWYYVAVHTHTHTAHTQNENNKCFHRFILKNRNLQTYFHHSHSLTQPNKF